MKSIINLKYFMLLLIALNFSCEKDKGPIIIKENLPGDTVIKFNDDIQPIFNEFCVECHNQSHPFLDLRYLFSYNQLLFTGHSAPYVDTVDPSNSYIIRRLKGIQYPIMPPNPPLPGDGKIDTILTWIRQGAKNN